MYEESRGEDVEQLGTWQHENDYQKIETTPGITLELEPIAKRVFSVTLLPSANVATP